ncbi:phosphoribosylformylglycinamidine (fgam) synthase, purs component [Heliomicrobium modesticaldum Ice1]|uniref:Phosphoribosylformylglycinamidine (Fgam) synthase, purs component n=1 Tax=Heliobacterium modesticaldum (strain ATCC 51547 / Ice1) TaxID=498761 RepID=B0TEC9_HELMI|nr:phosphoribosylformylglycinamidine synthase subunit PurS [Heliomicrobium modesticaldum]ABZ85611.1 phosphoribosylformylglycinamidine (fgam) synthase, purs component [Heliomicrobium modesticaldum Ice1]
MFKAKIIITVKAGFCDPQRDALEQRLREAGDKLAAFETTAPGKSALPAVTAPSSAQNSPVLPAGLRIGRYVEFLLDTDDAEAARRQAEDFCRQRLINEVLEAFSCEIEPLSN